mmetsp:Transcript_24553/g.70039  ORF Transcript_24553/g.70039 Transcript_24553/m.70039 type:complete len:107 (-) Transcript_24553:28-348(-)
MGGSLARSAAAAAALAAGAAASDARGSQAVALGLRADADGGAAPGGQKAPVQSILDKHAVFAAKFADQSELHAIKALRGVMDFDASTVAGEYKGGGAPAPGPAAAR